MGPNFRPYLCNVNGSLASIMVDLGLRDEAPVRTKPWLLWIWIHMRAPRPDGLSSSDEAPKLYEIEDCIDQGLGKDVGAVFCGRITTENRRELYFYGEQTESFEAAVKYATAAFTGYRFDWGTKEDAGWGQYLDVLYPGAEDMERIKNGDVLDVLTRKGDALSVPRQVMHWIYFPSLESRSIFRKTAIDAGFVVESEHDAGGERKFSICVYRVQSIQQNEIDDTTIQLLRLAQNVGGDYDGWETPVTAQ